MVIWVFGVTCPYLFLPLSAQQLGLQRYNIIPETICVGSYVNLFLYSVVVPIRVPVVPVFFSSPFGQLHNHHHLSSTLSYLLLQDVSPFSLGQWEMHKSLKAQQWHSAKSCTVFSLWLGMLVLSLSGKGSYIFLSSKMSMRVTSRNDTWQNLKRYKKSHEVIERSCSSLLDIYKCYFCAALGCTSFILLQEGAHCP